MNGLGSTKIEKAIVCGTAFVCACAGFAVSAFLLIPIASVVMRSLSLAGVLQQVVILSLLLGPPIVAGLGGVRIASSVVQSMRAALYDDGHSNRP